MSVNKLTLPSKENAIQAKINEIIDNLVSTDNFVTTDTVQNITGTKTFIGQKKIEFKQSAAADKLGFTCFNSSGTEIGAFEYRPSTIGSGALFNINVPYTSTSYVGFRYWGTAVNVVAPKVATAGTYYIPTHITDGTNTVTASNQGTVDISSLDVANTNLTNVPHVSQNLQFREGLKLFSNWGFIGLDTSNSTSNEVLNITDILLDDSVNQNSSVTLQVNGNTILDGASGLIPDARLSSNIARTSQIPSISNLADKDLSNLSATGEAHFQAPLVSGTNIKTINNTSILGSGNIDTSEKFVAEYDITSFDDVRSAITVGKNVICFNADYDVFSTLIYNDFSTEIAFSCSVVDGGGSCTIYTFVVDNQDTWTTLQRVVPTKTSDLTNDSLANQDLSNLSSTGQAVIDGKVNKSGDTMTGGLTTELNGLPFACKNTDYTFDTAPASSVYVDVLQGQDGTGHTMMGIGNHYMSNGEHYARLYATKDTNNNAWATIDVGFNDNAQKFTRAFACDLVNSILTTSGIKKQILDNGSSYMNLGNGIKVCWGYHTASTSSTITFPVTYTATNSYICIAFSRSANTSGHVQAVSATQSTIYWASSTSYIWIAIGY